MTTTGGYDVAVELSEKLMNRVLTALYLKGTIPPTLSKSFDREGFVGRADVELRTPSLTFDVQPSKLSNPIALSFPLRVTARITSPVQEAFTTEAALTVTAEVENKSESYDDRGERKTLSYIEISFARVPASQFSVTINAKKYKVYEPLVTYLVMDMLKQKVQALPLSPVVKTGSATGGPTFKAMRLAVVDDPSPKDLDYAAVLINVESSDAPANPKVPAFLERLEDFAVALSSEMFDRRVEKAILERFDGPLPAPMQGDESLLLNELHLSLENGYVAVSGSVTKVIDCWPDARIVFSGKAYLSLASDGTLLVWARDLDVDLPWWVDFLKALLFFLDPIVGGIVSSEVNKIVAGIAESAFTSQASQLLGDLTLFAQDIPAKATSAASVAPRVEARNRDIRVKQDALILAGDIALMRKEDVAGRFICNTNTKEIHRPDCEWVAKIKKTNAREVKGIAASLLEGFNGCWYCLPFYDTDQFAQKSA